MTVTRGHRVWGRWQGRVVWSFVDFPHRCPGEKCAIERFLQGKSVVELGQTHGADYTACPANSEKDSEPALPQAGDLSVSDSPSTS